MLIKSSSRCGFKKYSWLTVVMKDLGLYSQRFLFLELVLFLDFFLELLFVLEKKIKNKNFPIHKDSYLLAYNFP